MDDAIKVAISVIMLAGFPLLIYAGFVGIQLLQRRLKRSGATPEVERELEELRARVGELEQVEGRVAELEERMDFSERMLIREKATGQLKP